MVKIKSCKELTVIQLVYEEGYGTEQSPVRDVTSYWGLDGTFLGEHDPDPRRIAAEMQRSAQEAEDYVAQIRKARKLPPIE